MKLRVLRYLLVLVFFIVPLYLLVLDGEMSQSMTYSSQIAKRYDRVRQILDVIERDADPLIQMKIRLKIFAGQVGRVIRESADKIVRERLTTLYEKFLKSVIPAHDLVIAAYRDHARSNEILFWNDGHLGFTPAVASPLFQAMAHQIIPRSAADFFRNTLSRVLMFPVNDSFLLPDTGFGFHFFNGGKDQRCFFLANDPHLDSGRSVKSILGILIDSRTIPPDFGLKCLSEKWNRGAIDLVFLPLKKGRPLWPKRLRNGTVMRKKVMKSFLGKPGRERTEMINGRLVLFGRPVMSGKFQPVISIPLPGGRQETPFSKQLALILGILAGAFFLNLAGQKLLFRQQPRFSAGLLLLTVFLLTAILPLTGISGISRFIVFEEEKREIQKATQSLHEQLVWFDHQSRMDQAQLVQAIRNLSGGKMVGKQLLREEQTHRDLGFLGAFAKLVVREFSGGDWDSLNGFLIAVGPDNFSRFWNRNTRNPGSNPEDMCRLLLPILRKLLQQLVHNTQSENARAPTEPPATDREGIQYEMVREMFIQVVGQTSFFNLTYHPERLQSLQMNVGKLTYMCTPIFLDGLPRYFISWLWDDAHMRSRSFLRFAQPSLQTSRDKYFFSYAREQGIYAEPLGLASRPVLFDALERVKESKAMLQNTTKTRSGTELLECLPSTSITSCVFSGIRTIEDSSGRMQTWFISVFSAAIGLAILLAMLATLFFMAPLRRILAAIKRIRPGKYDERLDDDRRTDEFGTLAQAFNSMMKGLQEKELLDHYVSASVRRMISNPVYLKAAQEGELRDVTVLFSGLHGFEEYQETASSEEIFQLINAKFGILAAAVEKHGGEISKVIGEKILVLFDHADCGSGQKAVSAALRVIQDLRMHFSGQPLPLVFGLNSGEVIAGIIGSPTVRRDYTVIGDTVNLASRLATLAHITPGSRVVISGNTKQFLSQEVVVERLPFTKVKGKTQAVEAFILIE